jgi:hypothetical protein
MKLSVNILLILLTCLPWGLRPQQGTDEKTMTSFYSTMAIADAQIEQSLTFALEEDEMDYWTDQQNFEKSLKQENYTAYKTYIFFKRRSYLEHKQSCDIAAEHGKGYNKQASFYTIQGNMTLATSGIAELPLTNTGLAIKRQR